jgi:hypothetical protein
MPNWCQNVAYIKHEDKAELDKIVAELDKKDEAKLFESLVPNPSGEWDYDWSVENWGCKWDASVYEYWYEEEAEHLYISFDTAWGPPIEFYNKILQLGYEVQAFYREEGMCFAGLYDNGDDDYYEYVNMTADEIEEQLPSELDEMFSISQYQRDLESEQEDEEEWDAEAALEEICDEFEAGKTELREHLHTGVVKVIFTKKDGTDRTMMATLNEDLIPEDKKPKGTGKKVDNGNTFSVYDVEADGWRSFNYDTVKEVDYGDMVS